MRIESSFFGKIHQKDNKTILYCYMEMDILKRYFERKAAKPA